MLEKEDKFMEEKKLNELNQIKNTIKKIHKENKNDVPTYLDKLKEEEKMEIKEAEYDNDYLKYML